MKRNKFYLATVSAVALIGAGSTTAFAAGTTAGSTIQNKVDVTYSVGGVQQNPVPTATNDVVVDRKVNFTVVEVGGAATIVTPGSVKQATLFNVTNLSNDVLDFALTVAQQSGGAGAFGGTDNFNVTSPVFYLDKADAGGNFGTFGAEDVLITKLDDIAADASASVFVVADIPQGRATGDVATVILTAQALDAATNAVLSTSGTNTAGKDTVLADGSGGLAGDSANDGLYSARDDYKVSAAALSVVKYSRVISDGISASNPKAIPGASLEYCIAVTNASGGAPATAVNVVDTMPSTLTFDGTVAIKINGSVSGGVCSGGANGGANSGQTVSATLASIPAGETRTVYFQAKIN